jgi:heme/copper-type cytochrome/quinol oxidase subunit 1
MPFLQKPKFMIAQKIKIHYLFWLVSLIILLIGLYDMDGTLDINIHDTYFVIPHFDIAVFLSIIYFIYGFGYWLVQEKFKKKLVKILTITHSVILIGSFITYWIVIYYTRLFATNNFPLFDKYETINITLAICTVLCLIAFPIYITNLTIGIFRKPV